MNTNKLQKNRINTNKGFTLVEAMVAIMILSISVAAMLEVTATTANSARYANNEITASYLLQEAIDSIRNSRDTIAFQRKEDSSYGWSAFLTRYGYPSDKCFSSNECSLMTIKFNPVYIGTIPRQQVDKCPDTGCPSLYYYPDSYDGSFYGTNGFPSNKITSRFIRKVKMSIINSNSNEVEITATVEYPYGTTTKTQTLKTVLLNWQAN